MDIQLIIMLVARGSIDGFVEIGSCYLGLVKSPLNNLSIWKLFDNLRRSLLSPSIILLIILAFAILPSNGPWIIIAFLSIMCPIFFDVSEVVMLPSKSISLTGKLKNSLMAVEQVFMLFCFLPYMAYLMCDAIFRTLYRLFVSKKNLLEWQTAADVEAQSDKSLKSYIKTMWVGSAIAIVILVLAFNSSSSWGLIMIPSTLLWFISPYLAYYISQEYKRKLIISMRKMKSYCED